MKSAGVASNATPALKYDFLFILYYCPPGWYDKKSRSGFPKRPSLFFPAVYVWKKISLMIG